MDRPGDTPTSKERIRLLVILSLPYLAASLNIDGFVALLPLVREEFALTRAEVGLYTTFFFVGAAVLAVFAGRLVDRLGPKKGLVAGLFSMGGAVILYGLAPTYGVLLAFAMVAGLGLSIITPSINAGVLSAVPMQKRATFMGIMQSGIGIGGFIGASLLPAVAVGIGWRSTIQVAAVLAIGIALLVQLTLRVPSDGVESGDGVPSLRESLRTLLENRDVLRTCCLGTIYGSLGASAIFHYTVFLSEDLGLPLALAGLGLGVLHIGGIGGRPLWGWMSDAVFDGDRRRTLFVLGLIIAALYLGIGWMAYTVPAVLPLAFITSVLLGLTAFSWIPVYFISIGEMAGSGQAGTATGLGMVFNRIGTLVGPPVFGYIADATGSYQAGWVLLGAVMLVASPLLYLRRRRSPPDRDA